LGTVTQQVTRITANTCAACKDLLCRSCNRKYVRSEGKRQCEWCIARDGKRREQGRVIWKTCIEDPWLRRAYCTKCKRVRKTDSFRRLLRPDPDGNEYERSCLSCLKKPKPTAAAPLAAPAATPEASHTPFIEHDESSSYQVIDETSTAGNVDNNTDSSPNPARWTLGDALRLDYTSQISQLTSEILEVIDAPSRTSEKFGSLLQYYKEYLRIYDHHNGRNGFYAPMATFGKDYFPEQHEFDLPGDAELKHPHDNTTARVLCASTDELQIAMRSGIGLPDIPCIYIPKEEPAVQRTVDDFIEELQRWTHAKLEYQRFSRHIRDEPCRINGQKKRKTSGHMYVKAFALVCIRDVIPSLLSAFVLQISRRTIFWIFQDLSSNFIVGHQCLMISTSIASTASMLQPPCSSASRQPSRKMLLPILRPTPHTLWRYPKETQCDGFLTSARRRARQRRFL
jgi:hypothetical protein